MVETRHYDLQSVFDADGSPGVFGKVATQLAILHRKVSQLCAPVVLECGVNKGWSTGVLADACERARGQLVSVDIADCSDAIVSDCWTFLQIDDSNQAEIMRNAPILREGIDLIYIDSLHTAQHVKNLIELWYPFVRQGGWLSFDDVDPGPYLRGQRKDDANQEIAWRAIGEAVLDFFYANEDDLLLEIHYGSTGLAVMRKLAPMSKPPQPPTHINRRHFTLRSLAKRLVRPA